MGSIGFSGLLFRATGGLDSGNVRAFSPSTLYKIMTDPFWVWCNYHAPRSESVEEIDRYTEMKLQHGEEYERKWVRENYPDAVEVKQEWGLEALKETLQLMVQGVEAIYQPHLWLLPEKMRGVADLIIRSDEAPSDLGQYHYRVIEIKNSRSVKDYHKLQAVCYNKILGKLLGYTPNEMIVALPDDRHRVPYDAELQMEFDKHVAIWKDIRDGKVKPLPKKLGTTDSPWRTYADKILTDSMDLSLLYSVGVKIRDQLKKKLKVSSIKDLYSFTLEELVRLSGKKQGESIYYKVQAYKLRQPVIKPDVRFSIPRGYRSFYFDFETSDETHQTEPPHVYLIGVWDQTEEKFVYFLGKGAKDEAKIFRQFLKYLGVYGNDCLYHWYSFETDTMTNEVIVRHPELRTELTDVMMRCVDLMKVLREQFYMPASTYSIKRVAPSLGFSWRQKDVGAFESMVLYWEWLKDRDDEKIQKVIHYNEDDCMAMVHIDNYITNRFAKPTLRQ